MIEQLNARSIFIVKQLLWPNE